MPVKTRAAMGATSKLRCLGAACCFLMAMAMVAMARAEGEDVRERLRQEHLAARADPRNSFRAWVERMKKPYLEDTEEFERRFSIWLTNLDYILDYNSKVDSHWLGLNSLADLTQTEYGKLSGTRVPKERRRLNATQSEQVDAFNKVKNRVDWRKRGAVSEVKDQKRCGGCWAFSATGSIEGVNFLYSGKMIVLSEQELIDCDTADDGCEGGWMDDAFEFVEQYGLDTEGDYKFVGKDESCNTEKENREVVTIDSYVDVEEGEHHLLKAAARQPISVAIDAQGANFQLYSGGIYDADCGTDLDHGVLVVGYNIPKQYWIVKNSWGTDWGEDGYIRLKMGLNDGQGQCGVATACSYPVKNSPNPPKPGPEPGPSPPPGPTPPVQCNPFTTCPADSTCCCTISILSFCLEYGCCPYVDATCCKDLVHCCPSKYPVCDSSSGECMDGTGMRIPWEKKLPSSRHLPWDKQKTKSDGDNTPQSVGRFAVS